MDKYYPDGDKIDLQTIYGPSNAATVVQVLKQCGDDLTRENVMRQGANLVTVRSAPQAGTVDTARAAAQIAARMILPPFRLNCRAIRASWRGSYKCDGGHGASRRGEARSRRVIAPKSAGCGVLVVIAIPNSARGRGCPPLCETVCLGVWYTIYLRHD